MTTENQHTQLNVLQEFEFVETPILAGISHMGEAIALKPCVENLGLNWSGQLQAIRRNPELNQLCVSIKVIAEDQRSREMICLPHGAFQDWLWNLNPNTPNFDHDLWSHYRKGLLVHVLMMLKISLDEIKQTSYIKESFSKLRDLNSMVKELDKSISEKQSHIKELKSERDRAQKEIDEILSEKTNQLTMRLE